MTRRAPWRRPVQHRGCGQGLQEAVGTQGVRPPHGAECPDSSTDRWGGPGELRSSRRETLPLRAQEPGDHAQERKCPKWGYGGGCSQGTGFRVPAPEWVARVLRGPGLGSSQGHSPSPGPGKPLAQRGGAQAPRCRCAGFLTPTGRQWGQRPPTPAPPGGEAEGLCSGVGRAEGCQHLASGSEGPRAHLRLQQGPREQ